MHHMENQNSSTPYLSFMVIVLCFARSIYSAVVQQVTLIRPKIQFSFSFSGPVGGKVIMIHKKFSRYINQIPVYPIYCDEIFRISFSLTRCTVLQNWSFRRGNIPNERIFCEESSSHQGGVQTIICWHHAADWIKPTFKWNWCIDFVWWNSQPSVM